MFWGKIITYGSKQFKQHMHISDNVTLRGMMRRYKRKYPTFFRGVKNGFIIGCVSFLMLSLIPGSSLPLQKQVKITALNITSHLAKLWDYNIFSPQPEDYLIKLNQIILIAMDSQIFDIDMLNSYFKQIKQLVTEQKKRFKSTNYMDILLYSEIYLQNIVRYSNKLLLQEKLRNYFQWVFQISLKQLADITITQKQFRHIKMFYSIIEYLLNFGTKEQKIKCVQIYHQFAIKTQRKQQLQKEHNNQFGKLIILKATDQKPFINSLKIIYAQSQSKDTQKIILEIFNILDGAYSRRISQKK